MTPLQQALVDFIAAHLEAQGGPPSTETITARFRSRNEASVLRGLEGLAHVGRVRQAQGTWELLGSELQLHFGLEDDPPAPLP